MNKLWQIVGVVVCGWGCTAQVWAQSGVPGSANVPRVTTVPAPLPLPQPVPVPSEATPPKAAVAPVVPPVAKPAQASREAVPAPVAPSLAAHGLPAAGAGEKPARKKQPSAPVAESATPSKPALVAAPDPGAARAQVHKKAGHKKRTHPATSTAGQGNGKVAPRSEPVLRQANVPAPGSAPAAASKASKHGKGVSRHAAAKAAPNRASVKPTQASKPKRAAAASKHPAGHHVTGKAATKPGHGAGKRLNDGSHP